MKGAKEQYETFVKTHPAGTFFQSWLFGEFQEKIPYRGKAWCLLAKNASCLAVKMKLPFGFSWMWIPYGPLGDAPEIFEDLKRIAKEENAVFARIEPPQNWGPNWTENLKKIWQIQPSRKRYTPEHTLILDISKTEGEILAQMKPKGRYNINVTRRHGIEIFLDRTEENLNEFYGILKKTGRRDGFGIHQEYFYENLLKTFKDDALLFIARINGKIIAGIIVIFYKDTATYYYGASNYEYRNLMAPYLLQWEAIREAKRRGMKRYDFLGIAPADGKNHPWSGITEFKKKFGGVEIHYPAAFDIIYKPMWYKIFNLYGALF